MVSPAAASGNGPPQRNGFHETRMSYSGGSRVPFPPLSLLPDLFYCIQNNLPYFSYLLSILFCDAQFPKTAAKSSRSFRFIRLRNNCRFCIYASVSYYTRQFIRKQFFSLPFSAVYINKVRKSRQKWIFPSQLQSATIKKKVK